MQLRRCKAQGARASAKADVQAGTTLPIGCNSRVGGCFDPAGDGGEQLQLAKQRFILVQRIQRIPTAWPWLKKRVPRYVELTSCERPEWRAYGIKRGCLNGLTRLADIGKSGSLVIF